MSKSTHKIIKYCNEQVVLRYGPARAAKAGSDPVDCQ